MVSSVYQWQIFFGAVSRQNSDLLSNQADKFWAISGLSLCKTGRMSCHLRHLFVTLAPFVWLLALRQQLVVLRRRHPQPRFACSDQLFWVMLRRIWSGWKQALIFVQPETVVRWHRAEFKGYWTWLSRHQARAGRSASAEHCANSASAWLPRTGPGCAANP